MAGKGKGKRRLKRGRYRRKWKLKGRAGNKKKGIIAGTGKGKK